jgi:hypothetical protein
MAGFDESLLHPDWRPRSSTSVDDTIFNAAPIISSDSRVSLQDRRSALPGQRAESQGSADFDVTDEINNASASAFATIPYTVDLAPMLATQLHRNSRCYSDLAHMNRCSHKRPVTLR